MNNLVVLKGRKEKFLAHELLSWQLKSRTKWVELGDANTKFFHGMASTHRNFNAICALKNEEDVWVDEVDQLKELGVKHFSKIFKDDGKTNIGDQLKVIQVCPSIVSRDEADVFSSKVTLDEVEGSLKPLKGTKSQAHMDGWLSSFSGFLTQWEGIC